MGLADELKTLQELQEKGKLTDQEYADAKAATLKKYQEPSPGVVVRKPFIGTPTAGLLIVLLVILAVVWYNLGTKKTSQMIATAVHAPITVTDEVQNVPANSWKAVSFTLPYGGTLQIDLQVVRGNPIDVFVTASDQVDAMNRGDWGNVQAFTEFNASKTKTYKRTAHLGEGSYYLVMRDTSLGILSSSASDISVKVQLNP
jgi:hypothetical protein